MTNSLSLRHLTPQIPAGHTPQGALIILRSQLPALSCPVNVNCAQAFPFTPKGNREMAKGAGFSRGPIPPREGHLWEKLCPGFIGTLWPTVHKMFSLAPTPHPGLWQNDQGSVCLFLPSKWPASWADPPNPTGLPDKQSLWPWPSVGWAPWGGMILVLSSLWKRGLEFSRTLGMDCGG